jgi:hypothetical protein
MSRPPYAPADAYRLLSDRRLIAFACDVTSNKAFAKADARTKDALGKRVADYVRSPAERAAWPSRIEQMIKLPVHQLETALTAEPVKLSPMKKPTGGTRIVGVPTFIRRCISNLITMILSTTGDHLLPSCARAYRPHAKDAVKHAVLDIAQAVKQGRVRYWAKLDFSSYFLAMPWSGIEAALSHYGYEDNFINIVMAVVRCPLVVMKNGQTRSVPNERGAQMGLAESATLANMLPFALDEQFEQLAGRLVYLRYSDDLFIGGAHRSDIVGAVRKVQGWCHTHAIGLKGVSPDMNAKNLVYDVKNKRIELLGAEIDANGEVRLPLTKLKAKLDEVRFRHDNLAIDGLVEGVSRYGDGGGTHLFDIDDVNETIDGFTSYWRELDPRGARRAAALIRKTFPMPASPRSGGQGVVWIAQLWGVQAGGGVEVMIPAAHEPSGPPDADLRPLRGGRRASGPLPVGSRERSAKSEGLPGLEPTLGKEEPVEAGFLYTEAAVDLLLQDEEGDSDEGSLTYGRWDDDSLCDAEGLRTNSFSFPSMDQGDLPLFLEKDLSEIDGAVDDPREEPPLPVEFENTTVVHIVAGRLPGPRGSGCVVGIGVVVAGVLIGQPMLRIVSGRPESAIVREMISIISGSSGDVAFAVSKPMIVKTLLQPHRRFRSPMLYTLMTDLHAQARRLGVSVRIAGGVDAPLSLRRAVRQAVEDDATGSAA